MQPVKHVTLYIIISSSKPLLVLATGTRNKIWTDMSGTMSTGTESLFRSFQSYSLFDPLSGVDIRKQTLTRISRTHTSTCVCNCRFFPVSSWRNSCDFKSLDPTEKPRIDHRSALAIYCCNMVQSGKNIDNFPGTIEDVHVQTYSTLPTLLMWSMMRLLRSQCKKDHHSRGLTTLLIKSPRFLKHNFPIYWAT